MLRGVQTGIPLDDDFAPKARRNHQLSPNVGTLSCDPRRFDFGPVLTQGPLLHQLLDFLHREWRIARHAVNYEHAFQPVDPPPYSREWHQSVTPVAAPPLTIAKPSPRSIYFRNALPFKHFRVMDVMTAQSAEQRKTIMTTFTIDAENNISAFATAEEAAAATTTPFDSFASEKDLAELIASWPAERLVATFNSLPGVAPVKSFKSAQAAASRIWARIQGLGEAAKPEAAPAKPKAERKPKGGARAAKGAPAQGQGDQEGHRRQERAQGQNGRQDAGSRRAARRQQDRPGGRHAATQGRRDDLRDHEDHGLAAAYGPRLHGRRDEEGRVRGRVLQAGGRRT